MVMYTRYFFAKPALAGVGIFILCLVFVSILWACKQSGPTAAYVAIDPITYHENGQGFVGSESCRECHADLYDTHLRTAHFRTSGLADSTTIRGSFRQGSNSYHLNDSLGFSMLADKNGFYQRPYFLKENKTVATDTLAIVIGSGTKGQTYLSWEEDALYQLQVSYYTPTDEWTNSPGMPRDQFLDARPVNSSCLECHVTFAKSTALYGMGNTFKKDEILFGVDCERCHGPSEEHVNFHRQKPEATTAFAMTSYDSLTRQQRLDACALCHSGIRTPLKPAFQFLVGDTLSNFSMADKAVLDSPEKLDVHGNQYGLLQASACFKGSETMDCTTCHSPHQNQRGTLTIFNQRCMQCHTEMMASDTCSASKELLQQNGNNCVACHMPLLDSQSMRITTGRDSMGTAVQVRTHLIDVYQ